MISDYLFLRVFCCSLVLFRSRRWNGSFAGPCHKSGGKASRAGGCVFHCAPLFVRPLFLVVRSCGRHQRESAILKSAPLPYMDKGRTCERRACWPNSALLCSSAPSFHHHHEHSLSALAGVCRSAAGNQRAVIARDTHGRHRLRGPTFFVLKGILFVTLVFLVSPLSLHCFRYSLFSEKCRLKTVKIK